MSHTVGAQTANYTWDVASGMPVVLQDGANAHVYGLDLISATDSGGAQTYFLYDGLGSATGLTDGSGANPVSYSYDAFGAIRTQTGTSSNYWLFTGEQRDSESSLYFLRARYYDPAIGRFLGQDPLGIGNLYTYTRDNPTTFVDPAGLKWGLPSVPSPGDAVNAVGDVVGDASEAVYNTGAEAVNGAGQVAGQAIDSAGEVAKEVVDRVGEILCGKEGGFDCVGEVAGSALGVAAEFLLSDCGQFLLDVGSAAGPFIPVVGPYVYVSATALSASTQFTADAVHGDESGLVWNGIDAAGLLATDTMVGYAASFPNGIYDLAGCVESF